MGGGGWTNRYTTFIVAKKKLNFQFILLIYGICGSRGLVENVIWGKGLAENVRIPSYKGEGV